MSIVTKTGDQGQTSLYSGERVAKSDPRVEAVGTLDELNAQLAGLRLEAVQRALFTLGAAVANLKQKDDDAFLLAELQDLEKELYAIEATLPPLQNFILPGGHPDAIRLHLARTVCRRAERLLTTLTPLPKNAVPYVNRLSDFLFVVARQVNHQKGIPDVIWKA